MGEWVETSTRRSNGGGRESSAEEPEALAVTDLPGPDPAAGPHLRL